MIRLSLHHKGEDTMAQKCLVYQSTFNFEKLDYGQGEFLDSLLNIISKLIEYNLHLLLNILTFNLQSPHPIGLFFHVAGTTASINKIHSDSVVGDNNSKKNVHSSQQINILKESISKKGDITMYGDDCKMMDTTK